MIDDERHVVELNHSLITGKKTLWVDGERVLVKNSLKEFIDVGMNNCE